MTEDNKPTNNIESTINAATGLVKVIPIYDDLIQPAAKQIGRSLETLCKAVNVALAPISGAIWSYEQFQNFINNKVASHLKEVPPEDIITPKSSVAVPAIHALSYTVDEELLSDMYAKLLASSMDRKSANGALPAFVEMIKQLTSDEAKLMKLLILPQAFPLLFIRAQSKQPEEGGYDIATNVTLLGESAQLSAPEMTPTYLDNLRRLGLIEIPENYEYIDKSIYIQLENSRDVLAYKRQITEWDLIFKSTRSAVKLTSLGKHFGKVCITGTRLRSTPSASS